MECHDHAVARDVHIRLKHEAAQVDRRLKRLERVLGRHR
jgi:hypothetical protein